MKLFAVYVGGELAGANIEVHDMRFVAAPSIEETYEELRRQWWGIPKSLHIDCWAEISHADGWDVTLRSEPFSGPERLYYVNLGGYDPSEFLEKHKNVFVVADSIPKAKARAIATINNWRDLHRDDMYEAEQALSLSDAARGRQLYVHLTPTSAPKDLAFTCKYRSIAAKTKSNGKDKVVSAIT